MIIGGINKALEFGCRDEHFKDQTGAEKVVFKLDLLDKRG